MTKLSIHLWNLPLFAASIVCLTTPSEAWAESEANTDTTIETIEVYGRELDLLGIAKAASEGTVGYGDFKDRPISRVGELVEVIPGAIATQHSGEGKANQYFLRGFNLDHGTDFSAHVDGVPVNLRTHGHGQGYLDLNFVIPEVVERVDYKKGPYSPENGDFSSAGSARYRLYETLDDPFVEVTAGEFGFLRAVGAGSFDIGADTSILVAVEGGVYDGPWVLDQDLEKINALTKITHRSDGWRTSLNLGIYSTSYVATDQVPRRAVESGLIDRFGFIDDDLGGSTDRFSASLTATHESNSETVTDISAYAVIYDFSLFSNFTYFLEDPTNGDEFEQADERTYFGGAVTQDRWISDRFSLRYGLEARFDKISEVGLFKTAGRQRLSTVRRDRVDELSLAAWAAGAVELTPTFRASVGLRGDYFHGDVRALSLAANSGSEDDALLSPSVGLAWQASDRLELYANYGEGFHSNDVRGATTIIDPISGDPADPTPILVKSKGAELGARYQYGPLTATLAVFSLSLASELVFVGDAGTTEANAGSDRFGVEGSLFWRPVDWLAFDLSAAWTDSEFDGQGSNDEIPGAVERVIGGGVIAQLDPWTFSARLRHFGGAPLTEDGSVTAPSTTLVNASASYQWNNIVIGLELLNAFNARDNDISYFFPSQLAGEPAPVDDIHFHPVEPRQLRLNLRYNF